MAEQQIRNMEDFAAVSGISRPTISKYFNDPQSVRETTRARIEEALDQYDYRPNIYAVNQNRRMTKNVGVMVPYLADPFFAEIARKIEMMVIESGFRPILLSSHGSTDLEIANLDSLKALKPAGALLAPLGRASDRSVIEKFCRDVPTVLFDSNIEGMGEAFVGSDNVSFVEQTVEYVSSTGSAPCFYEMKSPVNPNANKRRNAYIAAMESRNLNPQIVSVEGNGWGFENIGYKGAHHVLEKGLLPSDSIICSNDRLAIGFLAACYERGINVGSGPDCELRVASNDDHPFSRFTCPALTTAAHDYDSVSKGSVDTLFELIESGERFADRHETLYPANLIIRASA